MSYQVQLTERAISDLEEARRFIAQSAPETAQKWHTRFLEALKRLADNPEFCPLAPETTKVKYELRQFLFRTKSRNANRVLFTIIEGEVRVLAIRRPGQPLATPADLR